MSKEKRMAYKGMTVNKIVAIIAGALFLISFFMPYLKASVFGYSETVSINKWLEYQEDGTHGLFLGITIVVTALYVLLQLCSHPRISLVGSIPMILLAVLWTAVSAMEKDENGSLISTQFGLYICWLSAVVCLLFSFFKALPLGGNSSGNYNNGGYNNNNYYQN